MEGSVEITNRWKSFEGSDDLYRSIVDLGEGPKLASLRLAYRAGDRAEAHPLLDQADIRLSSWGGEPTSALAAEWGRGDDYEAAVRYRRFAYFNRIPSIANPTPGFAGATQHWLDIDRGLLDLEVTARPRTRIVPFLAFSRDSAKGPGRTTFVADANEYAVSSMTDNYNNTFRGGVRLRFERWTATIEGGTSAFDDSESLQFSGRTTGNRSALFLGRRLLLTELDQSYRIRGSNRFARIRAEARPWSTLTVFGQFAFSQPAVTVTYSENSTGEFVLLENLAPYTGGSLAATAEASRPRPSGSAGLEWRPTPRLRIVESVRFEGFHVTGAARLDGELSGAGTIDVDESGGRRLESNRTRQRLDLTFAWNRRLDLHGSYSYVTADAVSAGSRLSTPEERSYSRHITGAGLTVRPLDRLDIRADFELVRGGDVYFRTDRRNYESVRVRARYRVTDTWTATLHGSLWNNTNRALDSASLDDELVQENRRLGAELSYAPRIEWIETIHAGYERSTFASDIGFLIPQSFEAATSAYRERGHSSTLAAMVRPLPRVGLDLGGSLFVSTGPESGDRTRPTRFYDTRVRLSVDLIPQLSWNGDWLWIAYSNRAVVFEEFRTHLIATGLSYAF